MVTRGMEDEGNRRREEWNSRGMEVVKNGMRGERNTRGMGTKPLNKEKRKRGKENKIIEEEGEDNKEKEIEDQ